MGSTVIVRVPVTPSDVAVTVAGPGLTPLTMPVLVTVAIAREDELHVTTRPVNGFPFASRGEAESWMVERQSQARGPSISQGTGHPGAFWEAKRGR